MIFAHLIVGSMPVVDHHFSWFWLIGSIIPDIDHIIVHIQHHIFGLRQVIEDEAHEDKHHLRFKTKYGHSIFGAVIFTIPVMFISMRGAGYFFVAYLFHLLLDWPDRDEKQYFYPSKIKVRGFLPIFSKLERVGTVILLLILIASYL